MRAFPIVLTCIICTLAGPAALGQPAAGAAQGDAAIVLANDSLRYTIAADGSNLAFVDLATGEDYCKRERYVVVDFEGWRYFELIELDADHYRDYAWPYHGGYQMYRELLRPNIIESLTIWCNNLPPDDSILVDLRPVRALPLVPTRLVNPRLSIGGATVEFPVEIESGSYLEIGPTRQGQLYAPNGALLAEVTAAGDLPRLAPGDNVVGLACRGPAPPASRARVTLFARGEAFN